MKKRLKKLFAVFISVTLILSLTIPTFAVGNETATIPNNALIDEGEVVLGTQQNVPTYGTASTSTYSLNANNILGSNWDIQWYLNGANIDAAPASLSVSPDMKTVYLDYKGDCDAGNYAFTISCEGVTSNQVDYIVNPKAVTITSGSASKVYDGTPLTRETYEVSGFAHGEGVIVTYTGSQTEKGTSPNTFSYTAQYGTNLKNYTITENFGTLRVEDKLFVINGENYSELYDGKNHRLNVKLTGKNGIDMTDAEGVTILYAHSVDGKNWNEYTSTVPQVKDAGTLYVKVSASYDSNIIDESIYTMTSKMRSIVITSESAQREYDGTPLTNDSYTITGDGFIFDDGFESVHITGEIAKVGTATNEIDTYYFNEATTGSNYIIQKNPGRLTIVPKTEAITITTPSITKIYDGTNIDEGTASFTSGVLAEGDNLTVVLFRNKAGVDAVKDAGKYDNDIKSYIVTNASGDDVTDCYTFAEPVIGQLTINKRPITLTSGSSLKYYNAAGDYAYNNNVTVSEGQLVAGEDLDYSGFQTIDKVSSALIPNTFEYVAALGSNFKEDNYDITVKIGYLMLTNQMTIAAVDQTFKYDGKGHTAQANVVDNGQGAQVKVEYSVSTDKKLWSSYSETIPTIKDVGTLYISVKATKGTQVIKASYEAKVNPRNITITTDSSAKGYDGTALTDSNYVISQDGFADDEGANITVTGTQTYFGSSKNTIEYTLNENTKADNYIISCEYGTLTVRKNASIIEITSASDSGVYNGMPLSNTYYTANWKGQEVEEGALCEKDVLTVTPISSITNVGSIKNKFTYRVIRDGSVDVTDCYTFNCKEGTLEVTPRSVVINTASAEKVYDGTPLTAKKYTLTGDGFLAGDGFASVNIVATRTNAGTSLNVLDTATPFTFNTVTKAENYKVSVVSGTLKVNKRKVSVTSGSAITTIGNVPLDGLKNNKIVASEYGVLTEELAVQTDGCRLASDGIGDTKNTIVYTWVGKGNPANYEITENLGTLKVVANGEAAVVATGYVGVYDRKAHVGTVVSTLEDATFEYSVDGGVTWTTSAPAYKDVKVNPMTGEVASNEVKVKVTKGAATATASYTVKILPRELNIIAGSAEKVYDGSQLTCADYIVGGDGFVVGEECTIAMTSQSTITDAGVRDNAVKELLDSGRFKVCNYNINYSIGQLKVTKRSVIVISKSLGLEKDNQEVIYDGQKHSQTEVVEVGNTAKGGLEEIPNMGFVGEDGLNYSNFGEVTNAGLYTNYFAYDGKPGTNFSNYTIKKIYGLIEISKREVTLTSESDEREYDGTPLTCEDMEVGGDGFAQGEGAEYEYLGSQTNVGESANTFEYKLEDGTKPINYVFEENYGVLKVSKREVTLTSGSNDKKYDGTPLSNSNVIVGGNGFVGKEGATYKVKGSQTAVGSSSNLFTYTLNADTDPENYNISTYYGTLSVTPNDTLITITADSSSKTFDGTPLTNSGYTYSGTLATGDDFASVSVEGSITEVGSKANVVAGYVIKNQAGDDVTDFYCNIVTVDGALTIVAKPVPEPVPPTEDDSFNWLYIVIAAAVVVLVGAVFVALRRKAAKR